jgi:hypothetical protein
LWASSKKSQSRSAATGPTPSMRASAKKSSPGRSARAARIAATTPG